jgi:hypothetical protein
MFAKSARKQELYAAPSWAIASVAWAVSFGSAGTISRTRRDSVRWFAAVWHAVTVPRTSPAEAVWPIAPMSSWIFWSWGFACAAQATSWSYAETVVVGASVVRGGIERCSAPPQAAAKATTTGTTQSHRFIACPSDRDAAYARTPIPHPLSCLRSSSPTFSLRVVGSALIRGQVEAVAPLPRLGSGVAANVQLTAGLVLKSPGFERATVLPTLGLGVYVLVRSRSGYLSADTTPTGGRIASRLHGGWRGHWLAGLVPDPCDPGRTPAWPRWSRPPIRSIIDGSGRSCRTMDPRRPR